MSIATIFSHFTRIPVSSVWLALIGTAAASGQFGAYEVEDIGLLEDGTYLRGVAVNNHSDVLVVGGRESDYFDHAGLWRNGILGLLLPQFDNSTPRSINDHGDIVGSYVVREGPCDEFEHAFLYRPDSTFVDLHPVDGSGVCIGNNSRALSINNYGEIAGTIPQPEPYRTSRGVIWRASGGSTFSTQIISEWAWIAASNDEGVLIGGFFDAQGNPPPAESYLGNVWNHGFETVEGGLYSINNYDSIAGAVGNTAARWDHQWQNGHWVYLRNIIGGADSQANAINNRGQVVGNRLIGNGQHAMLWMGATEIDLQTQISANSGWTLEDAVDINDMGEILCNGTRSDGVSGACLLRPRDLDGDGLLDFWEGELGGIDANGDGTIDLSLSDLGAHALHKDLFVEIDAMQDREPSPDQLQMVHDAFAAAPVSNPDGTMGIELHLILDETGITRADWPNTWPDYFNFKAAHFGTDAERHDPNWVHIREARMLAFRYCVFANTFDNGGASGISELPGNDFMVTLGDVGWQNAFQREGATYHDRVVAGTLMHELGHTLGLKHGGNDHINLKPNYYSVMNYLWQTPHRWQENPFTNVSDWRCDYSRYELMTLNEANLIESAGFGATPQFYDNIRTLHGCTTQPAAQPLTRMQSMHAGVWADWNNNGRMDADPVAVDLTYSRSGYRSPNEVLYGWNDWNALIYAAGASPYFADGVYATTTPEQELTYEQVLEIEQAAARNRPGDMDCDGVLTNFDIDPFVLAITNATEYVAQYPDCIVWNADANGDNSIDNFDIDPFVDLLTQ